MFDTVTKWLKHHWEDRKQHALDLFKNIVFDLVPHDTLQAFMDDVIDDVPECRELLTDAINKATANHEQSLEYPSSSSIHQNLGLFYGGVYHHTRPSMVSVVTPK